MRTTITVTANKTNWEKIKKRLSQNLDKELRIGFFQEDTYGPENDYLPVAAVAAWQDLGAPFVGPKHIPPRPFMRLGLRDLLKSKPYTQAMKEAFLKTIKGNSTLRLQYVLIGEKVVPDLKRVIDDWVYPPNATFTQQLKGRDDPLVDTGHMRDSVKAKVMKSKKKKVKK